MTVTTNLLPNGKQQFLDGNGKPLAGGSVFFYVYPATTTFKNTWQDPERVALNTNPVVLDANGEAVIYGDGTYRQVVKDVFGVTIWDEPSIQFVTVGGDLTGQLPNPTISVNLVANQINAAPNKITPANNDKFGYTDSANSNTLVYILWSQLVTAMTTALETVFDTRYALGVNVAPGFSNLKVSVTSNAAATVTADRIGLYDSGGNCHVASTVNLTCNIGAAGANGLDTGTETASTFYFLWLIYNPTTNTLATLFSLSAATPTMPSGYTFKTLVSAVRNDGSSNFWWMQQYGRRAEITVSAAGNPTAGITIISGSSGSPGTPTWTATALTNFVPAIASKIIGIAKVGWSDNTGMIAAPTNGYGTAASANGPPVGQSNAGLTGSVINSEVPFEWNIQNFNIYYASNNGSSGLILAGWELNI